VRARQKATNQRCGGNARFDIEDYGRGYKTRLRSIFRHEFVVALDGKDVGRYPLPVILTRVET
jgi:hypothetical protein